MNNTRHLSLVTALDLRGPVLDAIDRLQAKHIEVSLSVEEGATAKNLSNSATLKLVRAPRWVKDAEQVITETIAEACERFNKKRKVQVSVDGNTIRLAEQPKRARAAATETPAEETAPVTTTRKKKD